MRAPNTLYESGRTVLCVRPSGAAVINAPYYADFSDLSDHGAAFVALDCGKICKEVDEAIHKQKGNRN
jgi:hypothetical protein